MIVSVMGHPLNVEVDRRPLGLRHVPLVFTAPRALFCRVEDTGAYGWALVVLITAVLMLGYLEVQTGLIDRVVDQRTESALAKLEESQGGLVERVELRDRLEEIRKNGEFTKLLQRLGVVVFTPTHLLAALLLIASIQYALVALTGRKPEYHTLMSIGVYAGYAVLIGYFVRFAMIVYYRTTEVDTSLGLLTPAMQPSPLAGIDPFRIWFWVLMAIGLVVTRQLSRRMAIATCCTMGLIAAAVRTGVAFAVPG